MQIYQFTILAVSIVVIYYCIKYSSFLTDVASTSIQNQQVKHFRPLIYDYNFNHKEVTNEVQIVRNIQGSFPKLTRRDVGPLPHKHVATKEFGNLENCNMEGNRIKHVIRSSASSLTWQDDENSWEIFNDRGNSNPDLDIPLLQYVIIKDNIGTAREIVTKVDQTVAAGNDTATKEGEWRAQDPRVVIYQGKRIILYHSKVQRQMWIYDHTKKHAVMLTICGHGTDGIQKNWSPLVISDNVLLLVYTIDPLVILRYDVDAGDGVCTLVHGHLPLRNGMDEPYGGTPFIEINSREEQSDDGILVRSFLSMGHTRRANDANMQSLISPERLKSHRIYRPVPLVIHLFCVRDNSDGSVQGVDTLVGCTFGTDVYEMWHEVESPEFLLNTKWKVTERKQRSVSFPYDLHVFQENNILRVGLEYEDCYSVYEDYKMNFDEILDRQLTHPMRVTLEKRFVTVDKEQKVEGLQLTLMQSSSIGCPSIYTRSREAKVYSTPFASEDDLAQRIDGKVWVVSHQYRHQLESIVSLKSDRRKKKHLKDSQLDGILDHYPYPIQLMGKNNTVLAPKLCIYIYGSIYASILSELDQNRQLDTMKIVHNDKTYPSFSTVEELLSHPDDDPTGIQHQFENFLTAQNIKYPVILVRDDALDQNDSILELNRLISELGCYENITGLLTETGFKKVKSTSLGSMRDKDLRERFIERFRSLNDLFESQPMIRLLTPNKTHDEERL